MMGLRIKNFSAGYPKVEIIKALSANPLPRGKITALIGPNGSGKSTLLRALAGLHPAQGELWLDGIDLSRLSLLQRGEKVVYLPQTLPTGIHLQVLESVLVAKKVSMASPGLSNSLMTDALELLNQLGIAHLALSYLDELSGGQKQLVGLAQSLIRTPAVLLLDEPLSALDLNYQYHVMELVKKETYQRNIITIIVLHDINIALRHSDIIFVLKEGELVADGEPRKVVTPHLLKKIYGVDSRLEYCSLGYPQILIDALAK